MPKFHTAIIVIDPLVGFCDDEGSLAKAYGVDELSTIKKTMKRLVRFLEEHAESALKVLVRSEYQPCQFVQEESHPLAHLCVPTSNSDCDLSAFFNPELFDLTFTKSEHSAMSSKNFRNWIDREIEQEISKFILTGVLLEHCVSKTAEELVNAYPALHGAVSVHAELCASREAKYSGGYDSVVNQTLRVLQEKQVLIYRE